MNTTVRARLGALALAACGVAAMFGFGSSSNAMAQKPWPTRPITLVVAAGAGSSVDNFARVFGEKMSRELGQPFVVDNRAGGNGVIGARAVSSATPDGYTLLFAGNSVLVMNTLTMRKPPYDPEKDFVAVGPVVATPFVIAVPTTSPIRTLPELIERARKSETFVATPGSTSISRMIGEWFNQKASTKFSNIAYPTGAAAELDVMAARVPVLIDALGGVAPHMKSGHLRVLAISNPTRLKAFPDIPTMSETIPGFVVPGVNSVMAPVGTPAEILDRLNAAMRVVAQDPALVDRFATLGGEPIAGKGTDLDRLFHEQRELFTKLLAQANIKPE